MQSLLEVWSKVEVMNIKKNVRIDDITRGVKHAIKMNVNGADQIKEYDFIVFADDLKQYIDFNRDRSHAEYQLFLRPTSKYIIKTLLDSSDVIRGQTPVDFYAESFKNLNMVEYPLAYGIDSYATYNGHQGVSYERNEVENTADADDGELCHRLGYFWKRNLKAIVYGRVVLFVLLLCVM